MEPSEMLDLQDRVVVVTGATRGIGRAAATAFGRAGSKVVVVGRSTRATPNAYMSGTVEDAVEELQAQGVEALGVPADLGDPSQTEEIARRTLEVYGRCDVLINNAAYTANMPMLDAGSKRWEVGFRLQVVGPHQLCQAFVPGMIERGVGRVINVSSGASQSLMPYLALYGVTKLAMERWNDFLHVELGGKGVSFNVLRVDEIVRSAGFELVLQRQGESVATGGKGIGATMSTDESAEFLTYMARLPSSWSGHVVGFEDLRQMQKG